MTTLSDAFDMIAQDDAESMLKKEAQATRHGLLRDFPSEVRRVLRDHEAWCSCRVSGYTRNCGHFIEELLALARVLR
jgi:hypothetical protein